VATLKNKLWTLVKQREIKEGRTITQGELAEKLGVTRKTVSAWLDNRVNQFDGTLIARMAEYFECEIEDILYIDHAKG
jgi:DNA-binding XRE family transcriptional regulator